MGRFRLTATAPKFGLLLDLAKENSSDKRRELLRQITNNLLSDSNAQTSENCAAFDAIASTVMSDLTAEVRMELARNVATSPLPLTGTARCLAMDDIAIARPVIEQSKALSQDDLLEVARNKSQDHLLAITKRDDIGETVSSVVVERGEDLIVASLLSNKSAKIDRTTYEIIGERSQTSAILQAPFVRRKGVPLDLLNDVYTSVSAELRREILKQNENVSPEVLDAALARSQNRLAKAYGALPEDFETAQRNLRKLERAGELKPAVLARLMREGPNSKTLFLLTLGKLTDVDFAVASRVIEARDVDALALLCRVAGFDRALFVTLSLSAVGEEGAMSKLDDFARLYEQVPAETAQRAVRFWKVRAKA